MFIKIDWVKKQILVNPLSKYLFTKEFLEYVGIISGYLPWLNQSQPGDKCDCTTHNIAHTNWFMGVKNCLCRKVYLPHTTSIKLNVVFKGKPLTLCRLDRVGIWKFEILKIYILWSLMEIPQCYHSVHFVVYHIFLGVLKDQRRYMGRIFID